MASSGIDYDVKLWAPTASDPTQLNNIDKIIETNQENVNKEKIFSFIKTF